MDKMSLLPNLVSLQDSNSGYIVASCIVVLESIGELIQKSGELLRFRVG